MGVAVLVGLLVCWSISLIVQVCEVNYCNFLLDSPKISLDKAQKVRKNLCCKTEERIKP